MATTTSTTVRASGQTGVLLGALLVLAVAVLLSLAVGRELLAPATVWHEIWNDTGSPAGDIVRGLRLDRTLVALAVGAALGAAGALMQALTRNPLADPGLLGVNAGSAAAVVTGVALLGITEPTVHLWLAFVGAAVAAVVVYALGSGGRAATTPVRLALAGAAVTAVLTAYVHGISLRDQRAFDTLRFWNAGSVTARELSVLGQALPFLVLGGLLALGLTASLNAIALGDDTGRALGARLTRTRVLAAVAITLLCGGATSVAGPIAFVGLTVPHLARRLVGPDQRWLVPLSMLLGATLVLVADTIGRVVTDGREIEAGIMTALVGAPFFVMLVRRKRLVHL